MRRLVRHGFAGVGAAMFAVVAGVTTLGAPATTTAAGPPVVTAVPPGEFVPVRYAPADPVADAERAEAAERDTREADRTRIAAAAAKAAYERAVSLGTQGEAIDKKSGEIKAAKKRASQIEAAKKKASAIEAAKKKAEAAEAAAEVAAQKARDAVIANQGYTPGTTDVHEIARQILENKFSYGDDQFACFSWIISHESNWDVHATNASSGAYGLPQSLPGSKMASVAPDWRDNPATQIIWGAAYMKDRYGSPCGAKSHWESAGNY